MFYEGRDDYGCFANTTAGTPIQFNAFGKLYEMPHSECLYQLSKILATNNITPADKQKLFDTEYENMRYMSGGEAQNYATGKPAIFNPTDSDFHKPVGGKFHDFDNKGNATKGAKDEMALKEEVMYQDILMKITQHGPMLQALLSVKDDNIIENTSLASYYDGYWGNGWKDPQGADRSPGDGRNALGRLLKKAAQELHKESQIEPGKTNGIKVRFGYSKDLCDKLGITSQEIDESKTVSPKVVQDKNSIEKRVLVDPKTRISNMHAKAGDHNKTNIQDPNPNLTRHISKPTINIDVAQLTKDIKQRLEKNDNVTIKSVNLPGNGEVHLNFNTIQDAQSYVLNKTRNTATINFGTNTVVLTQGKAAHKLGDLYPEIRGVSTIITPTAVQALQSPAQPAAVAPAPAVPDPKTTWPFTGNPYPGFAKLQQVLDYRTLSVDGENLKIAFKEVGGSYANSLYSQYKGEGAIYNHEDGSVTLPKVALEKLIQSKINTQTYQEHFVNIVDVIKKEQASFNTISTPSTAPSTSASVPSKPALASVVSSFTPAANAGAEEIKRLQNHFMLQAEYDHVSGFSIGEDEKKNSSEVIKVSFRTQKEAQDYSARYNYAPARKVDGRDIWYVPISQKRVEQELDVDLSVIGKDHKRHQDTYAMAKEVGLFQNASATVSPASARVAASPQQTLLPAGISPLVPPSSYVPAPEIIKPHGETSSIPTVAPIKALLEQYRTHTPREYYSSAAITTKAYQQTTPQTAEEFRTKFNKIYNDIPNTLHLQVTNQPHQEVTQIAEAVNDLAMKGPPPLKMDNLDPAAPKFVFDPTERKYNITIPDNFSGHVFVPRLDKDNKIVGHDLLAYQNKELDSKNCCINNPKEGSNVQTEIVEQCRKGQQEHIGKQVAQGRGTSSGPGSMPYNHQHGVISGGRM